MQEFVQDLEKLQQIVEEGELFNECAAPSLVDDFVGFAEPQENRRVAAEMFKEGAAPSLVDDFAKMKDMSEAV